MDGARRSGLIYMDIDDFEESLADRPEHEKWELIGRRVVKMMVGARWSHHQIVQNINFALTRHFRQGRRPCRTFTETFWLKERFLHLAVFPDVMVHCGPIDRNAASINDPVVLFEVVSPGSERRDRVEKDNLYRRLASLRHYVLVERDEPQVDVLSRDRDPIWTEPQVARGLSDIIHLPALDLDLPLAEIYQGVLDTST